MYQRTVLTEFYQVIPRTYISKEDWAKLKEAKVFLSTKRFRTEQEAVIQLQSVECTLGIKGLCVAKVTLSEAGQKGKAERIRRSKDVDMQDSVAAVLQSRKEGSCQAPF